MDVHILESGTFMTKGEDMFCGLSKVNWQKYYPPEKNGLCKWVMRCLLIIDEERKILIDTGPGTKLSPQIIEQYHLSGTDQLAESLHMSGLSLNDITHVVLTHLHFDHCGGSTKLNSNGDLVPTFRNAQYYVGKKQWDYAQNPFEKDIDSYFLDDFLPLKKQGRLCFVKQEGEILPGISVRIVNGHSPGQLIPFIQSGQEQIVFAADLLPSTAHIRKNYVMSYDLYPEISCHEKEIFIQEAIKNNSTIIFQHDNWVKSKHIENLDFD